MANDWQTKVLIPAAAVLVLAIAIHSGDAIKKLYGEYVDSNKKYTLEGTILNAGIGVSKAIIIFDQNDTIYTDVKGKFYVTDFTKGKHNYSVIFRNADYPFSFLTRDSLLIKETQDLSGIFVKEAQDKPIKMVTPPSDKKIERAVAVKPEKRLVVTGKIPDNNARISEPVKESVIEPEKNNVDNPALTMSPIEILQKIRLRVYKDPTDKLNQEQIAYHYYLDGESHYLDRIVQVSYRRNDASFDEYKYNKVLISDDRSTKFDIKGYQWGFVSTTYVSITLDDGTYTDLILKSIAYDN